MIDMSSRWTPIIATVAILAVGSAVSGCGDSGSSTSREPVGPLREGVWRAWLESPGGPLPFGLVLRPSEGGWKAWIINGSERIEVETVSVVDRSVHLGFDTYDSAIDAAMSRPGDHLTGHWQRGGPGSGRQDDMVFEAVAGAAPRFARRPGGGDRAPIDVTGRWRVRFEKDGDAVGMFRSELTGRARGTFMTPTGDYRFLAGMTDGDRLLLSCFDGAHAFLFDARATKKAPPESATARPRALALEGRFWSRSSWEDTWTAVRDDKAALADGFGRTRWNPDASLASVVFPDPDGTRWSLADPLFAGRARIVLIFGTWCPNCNDATNLMVNLHREYKDRGLSILGLAFERTGDFARDAAQVKHYIARHGIEYPVLIAGVADKKKASKVLPFLDRVRAYPTTVFLREDGGMKAVYSGFEGPATGEAHEALVRRFRTIIEELLGS